MWTNFYNSFSCGFSDKLQRKLNKLYHLTSNLLLHYLAKIKCSTVQLYSTLFHANMMQSCLCTLSVYQRCHVLFHMSKEINLHCCSMCKNRLPRRILCFKSRTRLVNGQSLLKYCSAKRLANNAAKNFSDVKQC